MGEPSRVEQHVQIAYADLAKYNVKVSIQSVNNGDQTPANVVAVVLIQAIRPALVNFLPIRTPMDLVACTDDNPDWNVNLTFKDGSELALFTNGSNMIYGGGPWQVSYRGHYYLQYSADLLKVFINLFDALHLQLGQPDAEFCVAQNVLNKAFP